MGVLAAAVALLALALTSGLRSAGAQLPDDRVFVLGDSIVVAAEPAIRERLPDHTVTVDAVVNRPTTVAPDILATRDTELGSIVVVALGANDAGWGFPAKVAATMAELRSVPVVIWVNQHEVRPEFVSANETLATAATVWPNLVVADWNAYAAELEGVFREDRIHLTRAGADAYGAMIAQAVTAVTPTAWHATATGPSDVIPDGVIPDGDAAHTSGAGSEKPTPEPITDESTDRTGPSSTEEPVLADGSVIASGIGIIGGGRAGSAGAFTGVLDDIRSLATVETDDLAPASALSGADTAASAGAEDAEAAGETTTEDDNRSTTKDPAASDAGADEPTQPTGRDEKTAVGEGDTTSEGDEDDEVALEGLDLLDRIVIDASDEISTIDQLATDDASALGVVAAPVDVDLKPLPEPPAVPTELASIELDSSVIVAPRETGLGSLGYALIIALFSVLACLMVLAVRTDIDPAR